MLSFSSDTISFDTIFTTIGSSTKQFKIYNKNNKSLVIGSIELMNPTKSGFRMNIDGEKGTKITNLEILKKDSLFGFLEVTVNPLESNNPLLIRDSIKFTTNGNIQYVQLEAIGQDVYIWKGERITKDTIITNAKALLVYDSIVVNKGVKASVNEGVKFFFKNNASIKVHGSLIANGSIKKPISLRGSRFDKIEADIPYNNVPGQWDGIYFYSESYNNHLENFHLRNATRGITFYSSDIENKKANLTNVVVHNSSQYGVLAINSNIDAINCLFSNSKGAALSIHGGKYSFLHSTIVNYFRWSNRVQEAIVISNYSNSGKVEPLATCNFVNSIIYGSASKELLIEGQTTSAFKFQFINCLIKTPEVNDSHFVNTIWNKDPLFKDINSSGIYSYNFELQALSPAINKADKAHSVAAPLDLKGYPRLNNPDIGCYQYVP